jgi:diguanylate cyclase (GGDEF)-like protein/PAS domain S-box-containing protein
MNSNSVKQVKFKDQRVLIVDDDKDFIDSLSDILEINNFEVATANNATEAHEIAKTFDPGVALLDVRLGRSSGVNLLQELYQTIPDIVCMMITAYAGTESAVKALRHNAYDYLRKPVEPDDLLAALDRCFEKRKLEIERQVAVKELKTSEERYKNLYEKNPAMFFTIGKDHILHSTNEYGAKQLGYTTKELIGKSIRSIICKEDELLISQQLKNCFELPSQVHHWEIRKLRNDGKTIWVREAARVITNEKGEDCALVVAEDITEARVLSERLTYEASHDSLTGLCNRREFEQRLRKAITRSRHEGCEHVLCYIDLDQFKVVNDTCGHLAGDTMLKQISELLNSKVRRNDTLARLGGDEFAVLMEQCPLHMGWRLATSVLDTIREFRFVWEGKTFSVGASIGLVLISEKTEEYDQILKNADSACYAAKDNGRNRIHVFNYDDIELSKRLGEMQWVSHINSALDEDRFELFAQRIHYIGNEANSDVHYEVLLRMNDQDGKLIMPGAFLPAAERYNLSIKIDKWVFDKTLKVIEKYNDSISMCAINLSGHTLCDEETLTYIEKEIDSSNISREKICFEVTETAAIANLSSAANFIKHMRNTGCRFSLDDFGSGFSSFHYLKNIKVDFLKIDGQFIKDIGKQPVDEAMVRSINEIGHVMATKTIAEFVEDESSLEMLKDIGVDYAQGYYLGVPEPLVELIEKDIANGKNKH